MAVWWQGVVEEDSGDGNINHMIKEVMADMCDEDDVHNVKQDIFSDSNDDEENWEDMDNGKEGGYLELFICGWSKDNSN